MGLITAIWQKLVWCGLIGGVIGLVFAMVDVFQGPGTGTEQSYLFNLAFNAIVGTLFGLVLLGLPSSIWVFGRWAFNGGKLPRVPARPAQQVTVSRDAVHTAGRAAMVGSTAAVPGAVIGG